MRHCHPACRAVERVKGSGGPGSAHQIINDSKEELGYLSISTMTDPEICEYPDSGKIISYDGKWRHSTEAASGNVDYWKGEL